MCNLSIILSCVVAILFASFVIAAYCQGLELIKRPSNIHIYTLSESRKTAKFETIGCFHPLYKVTINIVYFLIRSYYKMQIMNSIYRFNIAVKIVFSCQRINYIAITYNDKNQKLIRHTVLNSDILNDIYSIYTHYDTDKVDHIVIYADYEF